MMIMYRTTRFFHRRSLGNTCTSSSSNLFRTIVNTSSRDDYVSDRIYLGDVQGFKNAVAKKGFFPNSDQIKMIDNNLSEQIKRKDHLIKRYDYCIISVIMCGYTGLFTEAAVSYPLFTPIPIIFAYGTCQAFKRATSDTWLLKYTAMRKIIEEKYK